MLSADINFKAKTSLNLPLYVLKTLPKYFSAIYRQKYNLHFQPSIAVATFVNWTGNLVVGLVFPQMQERITNFSFLPFTVALILLFLALFYYLPETKGMAVNDVEGLFQVKNFKNFKSQFLKVNYSK